MGPSISRPETLSQLEPPHQCVMTWDVLIEHREVAFFGSHLFQIYTNLFSLCHDFFGVANLDGQYSPWMQEFPDEFYEHVKSVAYPDILTEKWDGLLRNCDEREHLISAIVWSVLQREVFSKLLFGANPGQEDLFELMDKTHVTEEGFRRSRHQAEALRMALDTTKGQPPQFWPQVDRIGLQLVTMFLPLYNILQDKRQHQIPSIQRLYQGLHEVIAYAGWVAVALQCSPTIVQYDWPVPGDRFTQGHDDASPAAIKRSRENTDSYDKRFGVKKTLTSRLTRVKIAVQPQVTLIRKEEDGMSMSCVQKAQAVHYKGWYSDQTERTSFVELEDHIRIVSRRRARVPPWVAVSILILVIPLIAWVGCLAGSWDMEKIRQYCENNWSRVEIQWDRWKESMEILD